MAELHTNHDVPIPELEVELLNVGLKERLFSNLHKLAEDTRHELVEYLINPDDLEITVKSSRVVLSFSDKARCNQVLGIFDGEKKLIENVQDILRRPVSVDVRVKEKPTSTEVSPPSRVVRDPSSGENLSSRETRQQ